MSGISRREWLGLTTGGLLGCSLSRWLPALAAEATGDPRRKRSCILLWMPGGPSQIDTFDLKPGHKNGGSFREIESSVPGIRVSEHLPRLATKMNEMAVIRSMSTKEGDHARATYLMRTGYLPQGPIQYPTMGSLYSKELAKPDAELPNFISIAPFRALSPAAYSPGFLGPQYAPLIVGSGQPGRPSDDMAEALRVENLELPANIDVTQADARLQLLNQVESQFRSQRPGVAINSHKAAYEQAVRMMRAGGSAAFDLEEESDELRDKYGRNRFGQGCLLARRLIERGVPFVEVSLSDSGQNGIGWDSHQNNFEAVRSLSGTLDNAWATLMEDLKDRGLLDSTLIVWMGEFGRTPTINNNNGRDHFPAAWSTVLAGGGIRGGQVYGRTSEDGMKVIEHPVATSNLLSTVCGALGVDPLKQNMSNVGRPVRIVDQEADSIAEILA